jgi:hypothetical protein
LSPITFLPPTTFCPNMTSPESSWDQTTLFLSGSSDIFLLRELYRQWRPSASGRCWSASSSRCRWQTGGRTPPGWGQTSAAGIQNISMGYCHWAGMRNYWNFCKVSDKSWIKWVGCFSWPCEKITRQKCHWN